MTQVDEEPAIRVNTTNSEGVSIHTRKRFNAFTVRTLRDAFPLARCAGIIAPCATSYYYAQEIAAQLVMLPNVVVHAIDSDRLLSLLLHSAWRLLGEQKAFGFILKAGDY